MIRLLSSEHIDHIFDQGDCFMMMISAFLKMELF